MIEYSPPKTAFLLAISNRVQEGEAEDLLRSEDVELVGDFDG